MPPSPDVSNALARIRGVLNPKKEAEKVTRDIRLGLERISRVTPQLQEWQGVHVAGTNGKGSICAFLSGLFTLAGISYGRYVSPAFPEKHNAVTINGQYVNRRVYDTEARNVEAVYGRLQRGWRLASSETPGPLSPFELETATAFRIFNQMRVRYGIVEVGMGGATDATNVMRRKAVTVISKIDLDHQEYLGRTLEQIAKVKAGIMRPGVPCIVDHTNDSSVIKVLRKHASSVGTQISLSWKAEPFLKTLNNDRWQLEGYQKQNLLCAALAFRHLFPNQEINLDKLLEMEPYLPGRMEWVGISDLTDGLYKQPLLVDAAHNLLGVESLAKYTNTQLRSDDKPVTWIIGLSSSNSKPFAKMLQTLVQPQDNVAYVEYKQRENEPPATPAHMGRDVLKTIVAAEDQLHADGSGLVDAVTWAARKAGTGRIVVTGSLYLIRDFFQIQGLERSRDLETKKPGISQLQRFSKLWSQRTLSSEEFHEFRGAISDWHKRQMDKSVRRIEGHKEPTATTECPPQQSSPAVTKVENPEPKTQSKFAPEIYPLDFGRSVSSEDPSYSGHKEEEGSPEAIFRPDFGNRSHTPTVDNEGSRPMNHTIDGGSGYPLTDLDEKASQEPPKPSYSEVNDLSDKALHHRRQLQGYHTALRSIANDVERAVQEGSEESVGALRQNAKLLQQQADRHHAAYEEVMELIRIHPDASKQFAPTHEDIFGAPPTHISSPFMAPTELDPVEELPEEAAEQDEEDNIVPRKHHRVERDFWGRPLNQDVPDPTEIVEQPGDISRRRGRR